MFTRILTEVERKHIAKYLKRNGEKQIYVRKVVYGARRHLPRIKADLQLLERLLSTYEKTRVTEDKNELPAVLVNDEVAMRLSRKYS